MKHNLNDITLKSGSRGLLIDVPGSTVVSMEFTFLSGFEYVEPTKYEIPHSMEHMIFGANSKFNSGQKFSRELGLNGAYHNAYTSRRLNGYVAETAEFEWKRVMELFWLGLTTPKFLPKEFKNEQGTVREELHSMLDNHDATIDIALSRAMGDQQMQDYATRIGQLDSMTTADLKRHHDQTHTAPNMRFIIAGNLKNKKTEMVKLLEKYTAQLPEGERLKVADQNLIQPLGPTAIKRDSDKVYFRFNSAFYGTLSESGRISLSLLRYILVRAWDSRIFGKGRTKGLLYGVHGSIGSVSGITWFDISGSVAPDKADQLINFISTELIRLRNNGIKAAELRRAKQYLIGAFQLAHQTPHNLSDWYSHLYVHENYFSFEDRVKKIKAVKQIDVEKLIEQLYGSTSVWGVGVLGRNIAKVSDHIYSEGQKIWG